MCPVGPWVLFWGSVLFLWVLLGYNSMLWGSCSVRVLGPGSVLGSVDIFEFLLRKKGWVELCIMLATQSIEARAQQEGCRQACTIGLSINEDTKLRKGREDRWCRGLVQISRRPPRR